MKRLDRIIEVKINGNYLTKDNKNAGVQHEGNVTALRIAFDSGWDGYAKKVTWWDAKGGNPVETTLTTNLLEDMLASTRIYLAPIPAEPLAEAGWCTFVIDGYADGKRCRSIADTLLVKAAPFQENASEPADPTPTQAEQLQEQIDTLLDDITEQQTLAATAASTASSKAEEAEMHAYNAEVWAVGGTLSTGSDLELQPYTKGSKDYAEDAADSQTAAKASETAAASSAATASTGAQTATTKASEASASASAAKTSETNAKASETAAAGSAAAASTGASTATTKASAAATSAAAAAGSATSAANSAKAADTSADNASASATAAQTAKTAAETAKAGAEAAQDAIENMSVEATTLTPGSDATVTKTVDATGAIKLSYGIPQGVKGFDGEDGTAATVTVGSVTTGEPGTQASVTNSGTGNAAVLDFVIPRGDTGAAGAGTGDMLASVYDPQNKAQDVFAYADGKAPLVVTITTNDEWTEFTSSHDAFEIVDAFRAGRVVFATVEDDVWMLDIAWGNKEQAGRGQAYFRYLTISSIADANGEYHSGIVDLTLSVTTQATDSTLTNFETLVSLHERQIDALGVGAVPLAGGTMTGALTLSGAPTADLHAATKKYVDDAIGGAIGGSY